MPAVTAVERARRGAACAAAALLGACAHSPPAGPESPYFQPPAGSLLRLQRSLTVPAGTTRVHIQDGAARAWRELNRYAPYCDLEIRVVSRAHAPAIVRADAFELVRIERPMPREGNPWRARWTVFDDDDGPYTLLTRVRLQSPRQSDVLRLNCLRWSNSRFDTYLSLQEIQEVLAPLAEFVFPGD